MTAAKDTTQPKMNRLSAFSDHADKIYKLDDIAGVEVVVNVVEFAEGRFGEYATMTVVHPTHGTIKVQSSSKGIVKTLHAALDAGALPAAVLFKQFGNSWGCE